MGFLSRIFGLGRRPATSGDATAKQGRQRRQAQAKRKTPQTGATVKPPLPLEQVRRARRKKMAIKNKRKPKGTVQNPEGLYARKILEGSWQYGAMHKKWDYLYPPPWFTVKRH